VVARARRAARPTRTPHPTPIPYPGVKHAHTPLTPRPTHACAPLQPVIVYDEAAQVLTAHYEKMQEVYNRFRKRFPRTPPQLLEGNPFVLLEVLGEMCLTYDKAYADLEERLRYLEEWHKTATDKQRYEEFQKSAYTFPATFAEMYPGQANFFTAPVHDVSAMK
jgi:hypothetical protein